MSRGDGGPVKAIQGEIDSKARAGGVVPVSMAEGRHVSKPRGAKPGLVELRKETVLKVRPPSEAEIAAMRRA